MLHEGMCVSSDFVSAEFIIESRQTVGLALI